MEKSWKTEEFLGLKIEDSLTKRYLDKMPNTDEILGCVREITSMGIRKPGTEAGEKVRNFVADKFRTLGLEKVDIVKAETTGWNANDWELTVSGTKIPSYYMSYSFDKGTSGKFSTPEGGLNAEIVYVGEGSESDFNGIDVRGKIVVSDVSFSEIPVGAAMIPAYLFYDPDETISLTSERLNVYSSDTYPDNYYRALSKGAVGFVGILSNYIDSNTYNNEDYSFMGGQMTIPGLWISKSAGAKIIDILKHKGKKVNASLKLSGERMKVEGGAVVGYLPGTSKETIMIHSHHDSATTGAVEDASGTSMVLALAEFYSKIPKEDRNKTLLFTTMDSHFTGYDVHDAFIKQHLEGQDNILVDVCLEHIAKEVEDVNGQLVITGQCEPRIIFTNGGDDLIDITKQEVVRHNLKRTIILPPDIMGDELPTDADPFYQKGIPVISLISGPIYLYDAIDTLDKVAGDQLRPVAETFADIIWRLDKLPANKFKSSKK